MTLTDIEKITYDIFACACFHPYEYVDGVREGEPAIMAFLHEDGAVDWCTEFDADPMELLWIQGLGSIIENGGQQALWDYAKYCTSEYIITPMTPSEATSVITEYLGRGGFLAAAAVSQK